MQTPPPSEFDPAELSRIRQVIADPAGQPVHHTTIDVDKRYEIPTSATELDPTYRWFFLGFAYCLIKIDRSLFEVFQAAAGRSIPIKTHRAEQPIGLVRGADFARNQWAYFIQGIPGSVADTFIDFVASYEFKRADTKERWCCNFKEVRIADPLVLTAKRGVPVMFALPSNLSRLRRLDLLGGQSLLLETPTFGVIG